MAAPTIRFIKAGDKDQWLPLWSGYLAFYETTLDDSVTEATFARLTDPARQNQVAMVAEVDGKLIGFVHCITHPSNWKTEDVVYLQDLFVDPAVRGTGAGRALIEAVYKWADGRGTPTVYWLTQEFNTTARQLYDRVAGLTPFIKYQR